MLQRLGLVATIAASLFLYACATTPQPTPASVTQAAPPKAEPPSIQPGEVAPPPKFFFFAA